MEILEIVDLMIKSSDHNPYTGILSTKYNLKNAIELAKLCKDFADKGYSDEAMHINSKEWVTVIDDLEISLINHTKDNI
jgi:predicted DNA-binding protein (MmcQ/YjbR family)